MSEGRDIIEPAQWPQRNDKRVPVLAYAATAVPVTMDGAGVLYTTRDPSEGAAVVDAVASNGARADSAT